MRGGVAEALVARVWREGTQRGEVAGLIAASKHLLRLLPVGCGDIRCKFNSIPQARYIGNL